LKNDNHSPSKSSLSERLIPLGEVVGTHGLDGWLKLNPYNPATATFQSTREVYLECSGEHSMHCLEAYRVHKRIILCKLRGLDSIDAASPWVGAVLSVSEASLPALQPGEYYQFQAIGLEVFDTLGNRLGTVTGICPTGGGEIYVVAGDEREYLIPAVKEIIERVDFDAGKMIVNPPDGLLSL
jgi:16S rRNA processing protein RimM